LVVGNQDFSVLFPAFQGYTFQSLALSTAKEEIPEKLRKTYSGRFARSV
jgi:hypothetical protein